MDDKADPSADESDKKDGRRRLLLPGQTGKRRRTRAVDEGF